MDQLRNQNINSNVTPTPQRPLLLRRTSSTPKRRKEFTDEVLEGINDGTFILEDMKQGEDFMKWVMVAGTNSRHAIYCSHCDAVLSSQRGVSYSIHVQKCKAKSNPSAIQSRPIDAEQKEAFTTTVLDAIAENLISF